MTYSLDFALFYAYTLGLFAFLLFWAAPRLFRAIFSPTLGSTPAGQDNETAPRIEPSPQTRLEAFTRF